MKRDPKNNIPIRSYLLAKASKEDKEYVEMQLVTNKDYLQQISLVEDELIDEYLEGKLSAEDRGRFEEWFLCTSERQEKLRCAGALRAFGASRTPPKLASRWRSLAARLNPPRPVLVPSFFAALLVLAAGGTWALYRIAGLQSQVAVLRQQGNATESRWRAFFEEQKVRADQIAGQLKQEHERRSKEEGSAVGATQMATLNPPPIVLSPRLQQSLQPSPPIEIVKTQILMRLKLDLPTNPYSAYRAVLFSNGQEMLSLARLEAVETPNQITVNLNLPAAGLPRGDYEIKLYGSGEEEPMKSYLFQIVRK